MRKRGPSVRSRNLLWALLGVVLLAGVTTAVLGRSDKAGARGPLISADGPLTSILTTPDLNCAVEREGDVHGAFSGIGSGDGIACATLLTDGEILYGPATVPDALSATLVTNYTPWSPVSQTGPDGHGTPDEPFVLTTTVQGGPFRVVQTDSYVNGQDQFRTDVQVLVESPQVFTVYRAGDCFVQDDDLGLGNVVATSAPTCRAKPDSADPDRMMQWYPLTGGSEHIVANFDTVWTRVGTLTGFGDLVRSGADYAYDTAAGLSWTREADVDTPAELSHLLVFSAEDEPLVLSKSVQPDTTDPGSEVTYTVRLENPSSHPVEVIRVVDDLPEGFSYVTGSTGGPITVEPSADASGLTWEADLTIPGGSGGEPGWVEFRFQVQVSDAPGVYWNSVDAVTDTGHVVVPAVDVAPVGVGEPVPPSTSTTSTTSTLAPVTAPPSTDPVPTSTTVPTTVVAPPRATRPGPVDRPVDPGVHRGGIAPPAAAVPAEPTYIG